MNDYVNDAKNSFVGGIISHKLTPQFASLIFFKTKRNINGNFM